MQKEGALYAGDCLPCSLLIEEKQKVYVTIVVFLALELEMLQWSRKILLSSHKTFFLIKVQEFVRTAWEMNIGNQH